MSNAIAKTVDVRALTLDELDAISGGKTAIGVRVENCTTKVYPDGKEVQKCRVVSETIN